MKSDPCARFVRVGVCESRGTASSSEMHKAIRGDPNQEQLYQVSRSGTMSDTFVTA